MAPVYCDANTACDHNQLTMEVMKKVADRHDLVCLLHEKPFAGVNGSGKHNNWSLSTDTGKNLFSPGSTPSQNAQFLLFLAAFLKGVDEYPELLRCSVAFAGNDHRLGARTATEPRQWPSPAINSNSGCPAPASLLQGRIPSSIRSWPRSWSSLPAP